MSITLNGIIHGRQIDLDTEPSMPDGAAVTVRIEAKAMSTAEKRRLVAVTAGSWAADESIGRIFSEVAQRRRNTVPRYSAAG